MIDQDKSKQELVEELAEMRQRVAALQASEAEWRRTEEALQASEERFRLLVEAIPQPIWRSDADGNVIEFNRRWHEYTGQTAEEAKGSGWTKALHSDEAAMVVGKVREGITSGAAIEIVNRLRRASDGSFRWHLARAVPLNDREGKIIGWFGCASDIDDQKRAEEALRQSEEALRKAHDELELRVKERTAELAKANQNLDIFRKFAEDSEEGFGMSDCDGHILYANPSLCRLFGEARAEDVIGKHVSAYYPGEYLQRRKDELIPALLRDGHLHIEQAVLPCHGKPIQILQSTFLIRDEGGNPFRVAVVISDITERKQAEEALRASEERFRVAFEEAPLGVVMVVGDGIVVRVNRAFCQMSGYTEEELIGKAIYHVTHPEDRERSEELTERVLAGVIPSFAVEKRYLRKGGGFFWGQITVTAVRDRGGNVIFVLGIVENVTERKRAEEALAREHRNLRHMLRSSDNERQLIAYEIHDGLAQQLAGAIMQFQAYGHLKDTQPKQAANAFHAGLTMLQQGHFETRRLIAGVRPPILDESGVVEAVAHLIHELGRDKGPKIEYRSRVDFDRLDPTLENAIYRIAQEGLTNACKHSQSERISVSLVQRGDRLRTEIRDWGVGFDPKAVPKSRFGLEGIRQRARLLGGKCSIRSSEGKGTRITVELPVVPRDEEERPLERIQNGTGRSLVCRP